MSLKRFPNSSLNTYTISRMFLPRAPLTLFWNVNVGIMVSNLFQRPNPPHVKFIPYLQTNKRSLTNSLKSTWHLDGFAPLLPLWLPPSFSLRRRMEDYVLSRTIESST